jgi:hypothetical protein
MIRIGGDAFVAARNPNSLPMGTKDPFTPTRKSIKPMNAYARPSNIFISLNLLIWMITKWKIIKIMINGNKAKAT